MIPSPNSGFPVTRRWPRHQVQLPVRIATCDRLSKVVVPGLATEISRSGMALYGGLPLQLGDLMAVEFPTETHLRLAGIVRNRAGFCYGLEFCAVIKPGENAALLRTMNVPPQGQPKAWPQTTSQPPTSPGSVSTVLPNSAERQHAERWWEQHEAYMRHTEHEIERAQHELERVRYMQHRIQSLSRESFRPH